MASTATYSSSFSLAKGVVLVTGATGGIGSATCRMLAEAGAFVYISYQRSDSKAKLVLDSIREVGGDGLCVQADLNQADSIEQLFEQMRNAHGYPNMLVNMAARQDVQEFAEMSMEDWQAMMAINQDAVFGLIQHFCSLTTGVQDRAIVNVASIEGIDPAVGHSHYSVSKASIIMLTKAVAAEMAGQNIRVNSVSPGLISRAGLERDWPEGVKRWTARCPLKTLGQVEDVAHAICFLLSPAAKWINGNNLVIDGGMTATSRW